MATQTDLASGTLVLGNGAQFWAYLSPSGDTQRAVTKWSVTIQQQNGDWAGTITSENPTQVLQTPKLSGIFNVSVSASGPGFPWQELEPQPGSSAEIGCNSNCAAMVGIVATAGGGSANFWTVWDAMCKR